MQAESFLNVIGQMKVGVVEVVGVAPVCKPREKERERCGYQQGTLSFHVVCPDA
jgi:hypothetical protein